MPLTAGASDTGNSARTGAQIAVDKVNQVGGFLGRPFELVVRDDKAKPDVGLAAANDLVLKEKVVATLGLCNTGVAAKALDVRATACAALRARRCKLHSWLPSWTSAACASPR